MTIERLDINRQPTYYHANAVIAGDYIFTSYQAGVVDDAGNLIETIEGQTEQCITNLTRTLAKAGATLDDVVKITLLVRTHEEFRKAMTVYERFFPENCPARTTIITQFLGDAILIQLDAVAYKPRA
jgi:enamine deaminase RidA (YjgF/YER057c/UK114 family)